MATTTPNFGWAVPTSTDLVKDGAVAIETLGDSIDASLVDLKGGTTGQVLKKATNTDMDFVWSADSAGMTNPMTTTGDTIYSSSGSTPARLGIGSTGQVLTVASGVPSWATPAGGSSTYSGCSAYRTSGQTLTANAYTAVQWNAEKWDTNGYHDNSTNPSRFTIPSGKAGYYAFKFVIGVGSVTGDVYYHIRVNGTTIINISWDLNAPTSLQGNCTLNMAVGDYVEVFIYSTSTIAVAYADEVVCSFDYLGA